MATGVAVTTSSDSFTRVRLLTLSGGTKQSYSKRKQKPFDILLKNDCRSFDFKHKSNPYQTRKEVCRTIDCVTVTRSTRQSTTNNKQQVLCWMLFCCFFYYIVLHNTACCTRRSSVYCLLPRYCRSSGHSSPLIPPHPIVLLGSPDSFRFATPTFQVLSLSPGYSLSSCSF